MAASQVAFSRLSCSFLRVIIHVYTVWRGCQAYRPDGNENQQLAVVPKGAILHGDSQPHKIIPSALEQFSARNSTNSTEQLHNRSLTSGRDDPPPDAKCPGKGDGWKCRASGVFNAGSDRKEGEICGVMCDDPTNMQTAQPEMDTPGVTCKAGRYEPEPECAQRVQCPTEGGGWYCGNWKNEKMINEGLDCDIACTEPDYIVINAKVTCRSENSEPKFEPEAGCREGKHCEAMGGEGEVAWECKGEEGGREEVKHGNTCEVKCSNSSLVPQDSKYTCEDGNYTPGTPTCGPPQAKSAAAPRCIMLSLFFALTALMALHA